MNETLVWALCRPQDDRDTVILSPGFSRFYPNDGERPEMRAAGHGNAQHTHHFSVFRCTNRCLFCMATPESLSLNQEEHAPTFVGLALFSCGLPVTLARAV